MNRTTKRTKRVHRQSRPEADSQNAPRTPHYRRRHERRTDRQSQRATTADPHAISWALTAADGPLSPESIRLGIAELLAEVAATVGTYSTDAGGRPTGEFIHAAGGGVDLARLRLMQDVELLLHAVDALDAMKRIYPRQSVSMGVVEWEFEVVLQRWVDRNDD